MATSKNQPAILRGKTDRLNHLPPILPVANATKSFWHTDPTLQGHRTTADLPNEAKIVVIGSGITGATAAYYLHKLYREIPLMLEAREACWGATGRNGGHMQAILKQTSNARELFHFELANCAEVARIIDECAIRCEHRVAPACRTHWSSQAEWECARDLLKAQLHQWPELAQYIGLAEAETLAEANIAPGCFGGHFNKGAGSLWPYKFVTGLLQWLLDRNGINLQTNTPVTQMTSMQSDPIPSSSRSSASFLSFLPSFLRLSVSSSLPAKTSKWLLTTPRGTIVADKVLLATNAWMGALLPQYADLIQPVRSTMTALTPPDAWAGQRLAHSYGFRIPNMAQTKAAVEQEKKILVNNEDYMFQRPVVGDLANSCSLGTNGGGQIMLGGGYMTRSYDDSEMDESNVEYLSKLISCRMNVAASGSKPDEQEHHISKDKLSVEMAWTGIWGQSLDHCPWVGAVPDTSGGLFVCGGYTGHGMPNATLCARAAVKMLMAHREESETIKSLVEQQDIPKSFFISKERIELARIAQQARNEGRLD